MRVEHPIDAGASDEQWRALLRSCGIRVKNDSKPWGPLARRDFLNMLENEHPDRMPTFFDSREAAERALANRRSVSSIIEDESKKDFESTEAASSIDTGSSSNGRAARSIRERAQTRLGEGEKDYA